MKTYNFVNYRPISADDKTIPRDWIPKVGVKTQVIVLQITPAYSRYIIMAVFDDKRPQDSKTDKMHVSLLRKYKCVYTVSKKTVQICFCQYFVKFPPILIILGRKMAKRLKLCEMHSFSTSSNLRPHTTVLNADVRNCYTTLKVVICSKLSNDSLSTQ